MGFRISVDTGGTFTDVVIADAHGIRAIGKALTTPERIFAGMRTAIEVAAQELGLSGKALLSKTDMLTRRGRQTRSSPSRRRRPRSSQRWDSATFWCSRRVAKAAKAALKYQ